MGLLDEAIREHLELRRRHGADPDEVAREELDALSPVDRERESQRRGISTEGSAVETVSAEAGARTPFDGERLASDATEGSVPASAPGAAREVSFMEETAEIDMRAVLGDLESAMSGEEDGGGASVRRAVLAERASPVAAGGPRSSFDVEIDEDPLAWETLPQARRVARRPGGQALSGE